MEAEGGSQGVGEQGLVGTLRWWATGPGAAPAAQRFAAFGAMLALYLLCGAFGKVDLGGYTHATGLTDLGHGWFSSFKVAHGLETARWVWWIGTAAYDAFVYGLIVAIVVFGRGLRLGVCFFVLYALHWTCWHFTVLPQTDHIVYLFPENAPFFASNEGRFNMDKWFSGHTASAVIIALATGGRALWLRCLAWAFVVFQLWLATVMQTHYTIDLIGAFFVAYTVHRISLDVVEWWSGRAAAGQDQALELAEPARAGS